MTKEEIKTLENELRECRKLVFHENETIAAEAHARLLEIKAMLRPVWQARHNEWLASNPTHSWKLVD